MAKRNAGIRFNSLTSIGVFTFVFGAMLNTSVYSQSVTYDCGTIKFPAGLTVERNQTHAGFWPFAVGIVEIEDNRLFCAGTLISRKHVLTAAHCIEKVNSTLRYEPTEIDVVLGAFVLLAKSVTGLIYVDISEILVHPDWDTFNIERLHADAAILVLNYDVTLSNDIQIVCLPSDDDPIDSDEGFVVGRDLIQQSPKHTIVNVFNSTDCINENPFLNSLLSPRTICAGAGETLPMKNISGGGFFTSSGSVWIQHGIAFAITNATVNSTDQTIVSLMRVASFKYWIDRVVSESGGEIGEAIKEKINLECNFSHLYNAYACVAHGLNVTSKNIVVGQINGAHERGEDNSKVELIQFHNGTMTCLLDEIGKWFPNLKSFFIGYSDSVSLNTVLLRRSNFQHMENVFDIAIHNSNIDTLANDVLWDLPHLERFQLDGKLNELPERIFEKNVKLKEVYLASNALKFLPRKLFRHNSDLTWVNFENNQLNRIEVDFMLLPNIQHVFLAGNTCVNRNLNKTDEQNEYQYDDVDENDQSNPVRRVIELQRLIYSQCTTFFN